MLSCLWLKGGLTADDILVLHSFSFWSLFMVRQKDVNIGRETMQVRKRWSLTNQRRFMMSSYPTDRTFLAHDMTRPGKSI